MTIPCQNVLCDGGKSLLLFCYLQEPLEGLISLSDCATGMAYIYFVFLLSCIYSGIYDGVLKQPMKHFPKTQFH